MPRLLTLNSHEGYLYELARTGYPMDVIVGLPGHHHPTWDERLRPVPDNVRLISLEEATRSSYACVIGHSVTDLLTVKTIVGARILVLHSSLAGRIAQEKSTVTPAEMSALVRRYIDAIGGTVVIISEMKRRTWQLPRARVIVNAVSGEDYHGYTGDIPSGLRVANHVHLKERYLMWSLHEAVFDELPCRVVGVNPQLPDAAPSRDWADLKALYRQHRFYVHTASEELEDGYNLGLLEAMATGMPVVTNDHASSPVRDGVEGFRSNDAATLKRGARRLLEDPALAQKMGMAARARALELFPVDGFVSAWRALIEEVTSG